MPEWGWTWACECGHQSIPWVQQTCPGVWSQSGLSKCGLAWWQQPASKGTQKGNTIGQGKGMAKGREASSNLRPGYTWGKDGSQVRNKAAKEVDKDCPPWKSEAGPDDAESYQTIDFSKILSLLSLMKQMWQRLRQSRIQQKSSLFES